jgi:hypothetical protein
MIDLLAKSGELQGVPLTGAKGVKLGAVREIFVDMRSGQIRFLCIEAAGLLGGSGKYHPVPWSAAQYDELEQAFQIDSDKTAFKQSPSYDREQLANPNYNWAEQVERYFAPADGPPVG